MILHNSGEKDHPLKKRTYVVLDDESPTSANLGNDHGFIIKEYSLYLAEAFWGSPKQSHESLCLTGRYHTIVESRVRHVAFVILRLKISMREHLLVFEIKCNLHFKCTCTQS